MFERTVLAENRSRGKKKGETTKKAVAFFKATAHR
jgi:hypothetical protein